MGDVPAHKQKVTHSYVVSYPAHAPRSRDPHKADFEAYKRRRKANGTYWCDFAYQHRNGDTSECDLSKPLECHHKVIELALLNEVDWALMEHDFPGISKMSKGVWVDTDPNLCLYCVFHHRGHGGVHVASASDFGASAYIRRLLS